MTKIRIVAILLSLMFIVSCAQGAKTLADMNPKEKAVWMISVYNAQYNDYQLQSTRTDLSEERINVLRAKKKVLTELHPLISMYASYVDSGIIPTVDLETTIIQNLELLLSMI